MVCFQEVQIILCTINSCYSVLSEHPIGPNDEVHCVVLEWSEWSECSKPYHKGRQARMREFIMVPENGAFVFCNETLREVRDCNVGIAPPGIYPMYMIAYYVHTKFLDLV